MDPTLARSGDVPGGVFHEPRGAEQCDGDAGVAQHDLEDLGAVQQVELRRVGADRRQQDDPFGLGLRDSLARRLCDAAAVGKGGLGIIIRRVHQEHTGRAMKGEGERFGIGGVRNDCDLAAARLPLFALGLGAHDRAYRQADIE